MARDRNRREFNKKRHEEDVRKKGFKFPLDIDNADNEEVEKIEPLEKPAYVKRKQRGKKYSVSKPSVKRPTRLTISKASQVPSSVYGLNNPNKEKRDEREIYLEKFKNYNSVIVEKIVQERLDKEKRKEKMKRAEQQRRAELAVLKKKIEHQKANGETKQKPTTKNDKNSTLSVLGSKQNKLRERQQVAMGKRVGPNISQPGMNVLGETQADNYSEPDKVLWEKIDDAFVKLNVEGEVIKYISNGIIGRYEVKLNRSFRVSNIPRLNEALRNELELDELRIMSPLIGSSNIGLEVPVTTPKPIMFRTLFESSSLKLRKNDLKFIVGKTIDDKIFSYELAKAGHIMIYGNQPNYETDVIDNILLSLLMNHGPQELNIAVAADNSSYDDYLDLPHAFGERMSLAEKNPVQHILTELNERNIQFRRAHVRNIQSYNNRVKYESKKPTLVVIIDDLTTLLENDNADTIRGIIQILKQGKPLGIHLIANYENSNNNIRYELLQMLQTKISFYDSDNKVINSSDELTKGNDTFIVIPTSNKPNRVSIGTIKKMTKQSVLDHIKYNNR